MSLSEPWHTEPAAPRKASTNAPARHGALLNHLERLLDDAAAALAVGSADAQDYLSRASALVQAGQARAGQERTAPAEVDAPLPLRGGLPGWQRRRLVRFIEDNLSRTIRTEELAALVGLSRSYFFQAFQASLGQAPHAYLVARRVARAQALMATTDRPLSEIALACGLTDQPHLTRLFRRVVGTSPAAWRRQCPRARQPVSEPSLPTVSS